MFIILIVKLFLHMSKFIKLCVLNVCNLLLNIPQQTGFYERKISLGVLTSCGSPIAAGRRGLEQNLGDKAALGHLGWRHAHPRSTPRGSVLPVPRQENVPKDGSDCI